MTKNPFDAFGQPIARRKTQQELIDEGNQSIARLGRTDIHWYLHEGQIKLGYLPLAVWPDNRNQAR